MLRSLTAAAVAALAIVLSACGGGGDEPAPEDTYRAELDTACVTVVADTRELPEQAEEENLSADEVQKLADERNEEFITEVEAIEPPEEFADLHADLVDQLNTKPPEGDLDDLIAYQEDTAELYDEIGASGCAGGIRLANEFLEEQSEGGGSN